MKLNKTLEAQIRQHGGLNGNFEKLKGLFEVISNYYDTHQDTQNPDLFRDEIKKREIIEQKLNDNQALYSALLENSHDGIVMLGDDGKLKYISSTVKKLFGYQAEELVGTDPVHLVHPDDKEGIVATLAGLIPYFGQTRQARYRMKHKNGAWRWVHSNITNLLHLPHIQSIVFNYKDDTDTVNAESDLKKLFENITDSFFIIDMVKNKTVEISSACEAIYGYGPEEFYTDPELWYKVVLDEDKPIIQANYPLMLAGQNFEQQYRIKHKNGSVRWLESKLFPTLDADRKLVRLYGVTADITRRKTDAEKLQQTEANFRNIFESTDTAYVLLDINANILEFNHLAVVLAKNEMHGNLKVGDNYIDMMPEWRREEVRKIINNVLENGTKLKYEVQYPQPDGGNTWLYVRMHPIYSSNKTLLGLSVAATNITELKNAENRVVASNYRYEMVTRATKDVIWDWEIDTNRFYRSDNFTTVFGHTSLATGEEDVWVTNLHRDDKERATTSLADSLNNKAVNVWEDEYRFYRKTGEVAYVHDRGYILRDETGKPLRMIGAMTDVTGKKLAEAERDKITRDLLERNKDLEQFAYIVSHNLRAPVANILGFTDMVTEVGKQGPLPDEYLEMLSLSVTKLDDVIKDLNHILQVKQAVGEVKEKVSFSGLVTDITGSIQNMINQAGAHIETNFDEADEMVTLKSYLYSIFYNLITNSIKYRRADTPPHIIIKSHKVKNRLELVFVDNGMGINLEKRGSQVFGLYKRFHTQVAEGKGIGLFMVKTQVETLGGKIYLESEVDKGSRFKIEFEL